MKQGRDILFSLLSGDLNFFSSSWGLYTTNNSSELEIFACTHQLRGRDSRCVDRPTPLHSYTFALPLQIRYVVDIVWIIHIISSYVYLLNYTEVARILNFTVDLTFLQYLPLYIWICMFVIFLFKSFSHLESMLSEIYCIYIWSSFRNH